jgi:histidinol dehydrogenase
MSVLDLSPAALAAVAPAVDALAAAEGFEAHARAVRFRVESAEKTRRASPLPGPLPRRGRGSKTKATPLRRTGRGGKTKRAPKTKRARAALRKVAP